LMYLYGLILETENVLTIFQRILDEKSKKYIRKS